MTPRWYHRDLEDGFTGLDVEVVQRKVGAPVTRTYDADTATRVRGLQRLKGLPMTGTVDEGTADALGESARDGMGPEWFTRTLRLWDEGDDVRSLRSALGFTDTDNRYDPDTEAAVRRHQSANDLPLTGEVDLDTILTLK